MRPDSICWTRPLSCRHQQQVSGRLYNPVCTMPYSELFAIPIGQATLICGPLAKTAALVNHRAVDQLRRAFRDRVAPSAEVGSLAEMLTATEVDPPQPRSGSLGVPDFLGLLPTRGCNMAFRYCDFVVPQVLQPRHEP